MAVDFVFLMIQVVCHPRPAKT